MLKISTIFSKTHDFKTHLNPSNRVQNRFGVVEKIAIECFDPNPENQKKKNHKVNVFPAQIFVSSSTF